MAKEKTPEPALHVRVGMALGETFEFGGGMWWRTTPTHNALLPHRYDGEIVSALDALNKYWRSPKRLGGPGEWAIRTEGDTKDGEYIVMLGGHPPVSGRVLSTVICQAIVAADDAQRKREAARVAGEDKLSKEGKRPPLSPAVAAVAKAFSSPLIQDFLEPVYPFEKPNDQQTTDLPARDPAVHGPGG